MSDYSVTTDFSVKDGLSTGDPNKLIKGSDFDTEFDNIATAVATKYDSNDVASQAEAEAETTNLKLVTPLRLAQWADANAGIVGDLQALADPNADRIVFWDDDAGAAALLTAGDGIEISGTNLQLPSTVAGGGLTLTSGVLDVVGGSGITANANDIQITNVSAGADNPVNISSGTFTFDATALTACDITDLGSTDVFVVDDGGTTKKIAIQDMGLLVQTAQVTQTLELTDMNSILEFDATATLTIPTNAAVAIPVGSSVILCVDHATQTLTVTADTGVTLNSINHPGGGSAASDTVLAGGTAALIKTEANEWYLAGDITD